MSRAIAQPTIVIRDVQAASTACYRAPVRVPADLPVDEVRYPTPMVMAHFQTHGKAHVDPALLSRLAETRDNLRAIGMSPTLAIWFDNLLDKADGHYDYHSYIGTRMLDTWTREDDTFVAHAGRQLRLILAILADVALFELDSLTGQEVRFPRQLPTRDVLQQRIRHALGAWDRYADVLTALSGDGTIVKPQGLVAAIDAPKVLRQRLAAYRTGLDPALLRILRLSMLPVSPLHDEYLFIRILQAFETVFAIVGEGLRTAIRAIRLDRPEEATAAVGVLNRLFDANTGLFRMLSTMQAESFATFRQDTDGASAIQSERYKLIEVLAGPVSDERRHSPAFGQVPVARQIMERRSEPHLAEALAPVLASSPDGLHPEWLDLIEALRGFDDRFVQWKSTHVGMAMRFLGDQPGTSATPGTPYLARFAAKPLFPFLPR